MNILLLLHFPLGTAVGIYGLLKADKPEALAAPPPLPHLPRAAARTAESA
jgi:hypothetical protein